MDTTRCQADARFVATHGRNISFTSLIMSKVMRLGFIFFHFDSSLLFSFMPHEYGYQESFFICQLDSVRHQYSEKET